MSAASARQSQRVLIDAAVRLTLRDASRSLPARALDLSEGGMRVAADAPLRVGDEVTCNLELDNERAALPGRVRWSRPAATAPNGAGVQFDGLSDEQLALIRRWLAVNSEYAQMVLLHLPSFREPLRARGCVTADGLQLTAALSQLAPGQELEFQLGDLGSRRVARLERVDALTPADRGGLEIALRLQPMAATRSRRNVVYGLADPPPSERGSTSLARGTAERPAPQTLQAQIKPRTRPNQLVTRKRNDTLEIPKSSAVRTLRRSLWLLAAAALCVWAWNELGSQPGAEPREPSTAHVAQPPAHAAEAVAAQVHAAAPPTTPAPAPQAEPQRAQSLPMSSQEPAPAEPAPAPEVQHTSVDVSAAPPETQPEQKPAATNAPTDEEARLPALNAMGSKSEVFVPMQGSLRGLRTTQWTDPLAIVLDLPDAHIDSPELLRGLRGGGVLRVRLDDSREVPRLQIFLNTVAARFATKLVPHGLLVVLEHDLQPLPQ